MYHLKVDYLIGSWKILLAFTGPHRVTSRRLFVCDVALTGSVMVALAFKEVTVDAQLSVVLATDSGNHRISLASAHGLIPRTQYSNYHHHCLSSAETSAADAWATRSVFGFISFVSGLSSTLPSGPT